MFYNAMIFGESLLIIISAFIIFFFFKYSWKYIAFVAIFSLGLNGLYDSFYYSGLIVQYPQWIGFSIPLPWLTFPAVYILMRYLTNASFVFQKKHLWHFLPFVVRFVTTIPLCMLSLEEKTNIVMANYPHQYAGNLKGVMNFYPLALYMNIYYFAIGILLYKKNREIRIRFPNRTNQPIAYTYYFIWFICMVASLKISAFGVYAANNVITRNGFILLGLVFLALFLMLTYFPLLIKSGVLLSDEHEADKTFLKGVDISKLEKSIKQKIKNEKIFLQENLSLAAFASQLNLTIHQLSEYLNQYHKKRYQDFINHHRIEYAKTLLNDDKSASFRHVAKQSGFASYNPFFQAFKKETGLSPNDWIKNPAKT